MEVRKQGWKEGRRKEGRKEGRKERTSRYGFLTLLVGITEHKPSPVLKLCTSSLANDRRHSPSTDI